MIPVAVAAEIAVAAPHLCLGCLRASVRVEPPHPTLSSKLDITGRQRVKNLPRGGPARLGPVQALRDAYRALGKEPGRYRGAAEALLRRLVQDKGVSPVNTVVDINNLLALETAMAVSTFDADAIDGPVKLRRGRAGESYQGIGRGALNLEGLPVFADNQGPFGSPTSDSERTRVTERTETILMVIMAFHDCPDLPRYLEEARSLVERYAHGEGMETTLVEGRPSVPGAG